MYTVNGDQRTLAGAMYIASARPTDDPSLLAFSNTYESRPGRNKATYCLSGP